MKKILILSQARSGSKYLTTLISTAQYYHVILDPFGEESSIFLDKNFKQTSLAQIKNIKERSEILIKDNKIR